MLILIHNEKDKLNLFSEMISHLSHWQHLKFCQPFLQLVCRESALSYTALGRLNDTTQGSIMFSKITYAITLISAIPLLGTFTKYIANSTNETVQRLFILTVFVIILGKIKVHNN